MSLRRRLLLGLIGVAAVLVITNIVLSRMIETFLLDRVDRQLLDVTSRPIFREDDRGSHPGGGGGRAGFPSNDEQTLSEYFIAVGDPEQGTLTRLASAFADEGEAPVLRRDEVLDHLAERHATPEPFTAPATGDGGSWRLVAIEDPRSGAAVVGISLDEVDHTVRRVRLVQVFGTMSVLAALGLVSWWMLRLGVHPIEAMAGAADTIAGGDLSQRVEHPSVQTEAGRLGAALNSMLARIEEAFRARAESEGRVRRFAADASHELRTPLTSIQGYAELWRAGGLRGEEELAEAMRRMEQEAHRMGALVEDLLLLARLDQGRPLGVASVRLDQIVSDAVKDARAVEPERPIDLVVEAVTIEGDEMRLRQVVGNLLSNVRSHTPSGVPVRVGLASSEGWVRLEVADEGPGMAPDVASKVFERFYRADPSRARSGGTGLGLSIVAAIAGSHGGRAVVFSEVGRGSTFVVELPLRASTGADDGGGGGHTSEQPRPSPFAHPGARQATVPAPGSPRPAG